MKRFIMLVLFTVMFLIPASGAFAGPHDEPWPDLTSTVVISTPVVPN